MSTFPWLTVAAAIPLAGSLAIPLIPRRPASAGRASDQAVKLLAIGVTLATLAVTLAMAAAFRPDGPQFQFTQVHQWIPQFGVYYAVGTDGIALVLIVMTAILTPLVVLASWHAGEDAAPRHSARAYYALILVLEAMLIGSFAATDVFLFYVFFETMLVPMYFLIGSYGSGQRQYAAVKFLLYNLLGGLLMLAALIALFAYSARAGHPGSFLFTQLVHVRLGSAAQKWLFAGFFIAFAIKAPLWPFHTWLPDAAACAQPGDAVLMIGVMDKVGTFAMIRYCLDLFPVAAHWFTPLIIVLSVAGILYAAVVTIGQADLKRLIAYLSVSGMALITLGIFAMTSQGQAGAALQMVNHGFLAGALFLIAGFLIARRRSPLIGDYGGVQKTSPSWPACSSSPAWPGWRCPA